MQFPIAAVRESARHPGRLALLGLLLLLLYALPALIERRSDWVSPIEPGSLSLTGFEPAGDGSLRGIASEGDVHEIKAPLALRKRHDYDVRFDVVRPASSRTELYVSLYGEGYDRSRQRSVQTIDSSSTGRRMRLRINAGR